MRRRLWLVGLAAAAGIAILCALGIWQLQRLHWKEALLARLAANAAAAPVDLGTAAAARREGRDIEFLHVRFDGRYRGSVSLHLLSSFEGGPGWTIVTPAVSEDGLSVLVDRGRLPPDAVESDRAPSGPVTIDGLVRLYRNGRGPFDPDNDAAKNQWYWWDLPAMLQAAGLAGGDQVVPVVVQLLPGPVEPGVPRPAEPRAALANNHLGYAITWFGLALALLAVALLFIRGQIGKSGA